jgi:hypothetical protein
MGWEVRRADARTMGKQEKVMLKRGGEGRWRGEGARANTACSSKRCVMPLTPTHAERLTVTVTVDACWCCC